MSINRNMLTFRNFIKETRVLTNVRLTAHQKSVLSIMLRTDDASAHDDEISNNPNMAKARVLLTQLKLITPSDGDKYVVTDLGRKVATDEGILDGDSLSDDGNKMATKDATPPPSGKPSTSGPKDDETKADMPMIGVSDAGDTGLPESVQPFRTFILSQS